MSWSLSLTGFTACRLSYQAEGVVTTMPVRGDRVIDRICAAAQVPVARISDQWRRMTIAPVGRITINGLSCRMKDLTDFCWDEASKRPDSNVPVPSALIQHAISNLFGLVEPIDLNDLRYELRKEASRLGIPILIRLGWVLMSLQDGKGTLWFDPANGQVTRRPDKEGNSIGLDVQWSDEGLEKWTHTDKRLKHWRPLLDYFCKLQKAPNQRRTTLISLLQEEFRYLVDVEEESDQEELMNGYRVTIQNQQYITMGEPFESDHYLFWEMVFTKNVSLIVKLSQTKQREVPSPPPPYSWNDDMDLSVAQWLGVPVDFPEPHNYWPKEGEESHYEGLRVFLVKTATSETLIERTFKVTRDTTVKYVTQLDFAAWPDMGVPKKEAFMDLQEKFCSLEKHGPVVVHCKAGIGRTGTFLACQAIDGAVDREAIPAAVQEIRRRRPRAVETADQYVLIHKYFLAQLRAQIEGTK